jgi:hypothetical protein
MEACAFLAIQHLNARDGRVLPDLPDRLKHSNCDIDFTFELRDSRFRESYAAREFFAALEERTSSSSSSREQQPPPQPPFAILGAARSAVSQTLAALTGTFGVPQISGSSTSRILNDKLRFPTFVRTITSNANDAKACAHYLKSLGVTHFGIIYVQDGFGTNYAFTLSEEARRLGITPSIVAGFETETIDNAVQELVNNDCRYIVAIFNPETWPLVLKAAEQANIIGVATHAWIFSAASIEFTSQRFVTQDPAIARGLHGSGILSLETPENARFDEALQSFAKNKTQQDEFISFHVESELYEGFSFQEKPGSNVFFYQLTYDAVIALGLAACETPVDAVTGHEFLKTLRAIEFEGVSGTVKFEPDTGSRSVEGLKYQVQNILGLPVNNNGTEYRFQSEKVAVVNVPNVEVLRPFVYQDGTTIPPLSLPPVEEYFDLIPPATRIAGLTLGGLAILFSLFWIVWTSVYRQKDVVLASQPIFLLQLCVGALIMATTIIPRGFQEPMEKSTLDVGCMAVPWLFTIGFVTAFSALISKTWRLNRLFKSGARFRRISIQPKDVILPFILLMGLSLVILIAWTIVSPLEWQRRDLDNFDQFGRNTESIGGCYVCSGSNIPPLYFAVPLFAIEAVSVVIACHQSTRSRHIPTVYNESFYLFVTMGSILETFLLGLPIMFMVRDTPGPRFLVESLLLFILCLAVLAPIFWPKYQSLDLMKKERVQQQQEQSDRASEGDGGLRGSRSKSHISLFSVFQQSRAFATTTFAGGGSPSTDFSTEPDDTRPILGRMKIERKWAYYIQTGHPRTRKSAPDDDDVDNPVARRTSGCLKENSNESDPSTSHPILLVSSDEERFETASTIKSREGVTNASSQGEELAKLEDYSRTKRMDS